ncbi:MAG TPA: hypothetical protein DCK76_10375 [Desulfotomaculum sp.]|nr:hypothetical protein [Desulfotomaculum sp.]HBY03046.1 hypothetical protein [Desulfotomaculum sp.]
MLALGFITTNAIIRDFHDELDEQEKLIAYNQQREKTKARILTEAYKLREIEAQRAKERQAKGHFNAPQYEQTPVKEIVPELEKGQSRDSLAQKIGAGMSGRTLEKGVKGFRAAKEGVFPEERPSRLPCEALKIIVWYEASWKK